MADVELTRPAEGVAMVRINRPEARNALSVGLRQTMAEMIDSLVLDDAVGAIVIAGGLKAFAAGGDLAELRGRTAQDAARRESVLLWTALRGCGKPLIAAVNGFALGGGTELALHCDIIIAGEGARFGLPEVTIGLAPGAGGTQRFVRAAGKFKASRYLLTGELFPAAIAFDMGLVSEVVPDDAVEPHAIAIATRIARQPPLAVAAIKELLTLGPDAALDAALAMERKALHVLMATEDRMEGIDAFVEKRAPVFKGR